MLPGIKSRSDAFDDLCRGSDRMFMAAMLKIIGFSIILGVGCFLAWLGGLLRAITVNDLAWQQGFSIFSRALAHRRIAQGSWGSWYASRPPPHPSSGAL